MMALFRRKINSSAPALHEAIVQASRQPVFYADGLVPDSVDGRFELLALHAFLVLRRLRGVNDALAQELFDAIFAQLDLNLREMGVGDMGVGKRIKHMGQSFYGRLGAYENGLEHDEALHEALSRNLFGTLLDAPGRDVTQPFVTYIHQCVEALARQPDADISAGFISFPSFEVHP